MKQFSHSVNSSVHGTSRNDEGIGQNSDRGRVRLHLSVIGQDPVVDGGAPCDFQWVSDYAAYRCLVPGMASERLKPVT